jgi:asparagine synthase (glutamine-hydrolysing)
VRTFSIGFREVGYDEAQHACAVAKHLGTDHTEMYVTSDDARDVVPILADMFDEPFGDSSAIPTYLVAKLARQHVTVSLSGDGGDELCGGYTRYYNDTLQRLRKLSRVVPPHFGRLARSLHGLAKISPSVPSVKLDYGLRLIEALHDCRDSLAGYCCGLQQWRPVPMLDHSSDEATPEAIRLARSLAPELHQMMAFDSLTYLPDDILTKVDRAAMAVGLETRVPILDHRVVELAWTMPSHFKHRDGIGKWLLKQVAYRHVPARLLDRPKMGFAVPVDEWIRGPLRDWAEALLSQTALEADGLLDPGPIRRRYQEHLGGIRNWRDSLWTVLMWQAWRLGRLQDPSRTIMHGSRSAMFEKP